MTKKNFAFMVSFFALFATGAAFAVVGEQPRGVGIAAISYVDRIVADKVDDLATVATSGSYNDLSDKPTIPTVNNATLTIQKNGTNVGTFNANAASNSTINITIPAATDTVAGMAKLYNVASEANDGAMTAKQVTYQLGSKLDASKYGYIPTKSDGTGEALIWVE